MLAAERLAEIEWLCAPGILRIMPLELDGETLRLVLYLRDGTNVRVTEQWAGSVLVRYSYDWLTVENALKVAWDNAPHHTRIATFPHHKHLQRRQRPQPSVETRLEEV